MSEPEGFKGTPGEWEFVGFAGTAGCYVVQAASVGGIASFGGPPGNLEAEANATLFTASKDLLAALQDMRAKNAEAARSGYTDKAALIELYEANATASAAIAKALPQEGGQ